MIHFVLAALSATSFADIGAKAANLLHELRTAAHIGRCRKADFQTIPIEADAFGHFGYILFVETSVRALLAFLGTLQAGIDTRLAFLVGHVFSFASIPNDCTFPAA